MSTLKNIFETLQLQGFETDKGTVHSYIDVYEDVLASYRNTAENVLEIGVFKGNSLRMWEQYFKQASVIGVDCDDMPHGGLADLREMIESGKHCIKIFDAENPKLVKEHFAGMKFDVIIEDANHSLEQQLKLYNIYKEYLAPGGIYIIEDVEDIDKSRTAFETIDNSKTVTILDRRNILNRFDDILIIIK